MPDSSFLTAILPPGCPELLRAGYRICWPGEEREWVWDGATWVLGARMAFDGGDHWLEPDELEEAA